MAGRWSFSVSDLATWLLVLCALIVTGVLLYREVSAPNLVQARPSTSIEENWESYAVASHIYGAAEAPVTIVEFGDYECPACRLFHQHLDSLISLGDKVRLVYRHFPLRNHRFAIPAARASQCAADQGQFASMHSGLYEFADSLGFVSWWWYARRAGVRDSTRFEQCLRSEVAGQALARDTLDGQRLGVAGTPTLLIGSLRIRGVPPFDSLRAYIRRAASPKAGS